MLVNSDINYGTNSDRKYGANGDSNYGVNSKYKVNMEHFFVQPSTKHIICEDVTIQYEIIVGQRAAL